MKVLSLFDGISCARVALDRAGIEVENYYASEIDKYAIQISQKNYPDIIQVGSVVDFKNLRQLIVNNIDLLIGGSPCQDLSIAKAGRKGLDGERSGLFYEYVRILKEVKPKYFILENVASMSKESKDKISEIMGVEPIMINASLVSAQNRKRLFWVGKKITRFIDSDYNYFPHHDYEQVNITLPDDRGILLKDILENDIDDKYFLSEDTQVKWIEKGLVKDEKAKSMTATMHKGIGNDGVTLVVGTRQLIKLPTNTKLGYDIAKEKEDGINISFPNSKTRRGRVIKGKTPTLQTSNNIGIYENFSIRKLTPIECERLQGLPDNYTEGVSNTQRYKTLGNAFNVDVVAHILKHLV
jgi:DNA-cytosine methyltransferase